MLINTEGATRLLGLSKTMLDRARAVNNPAPQTQPPAAPARRLGRPRLIP